MSPGETAPTMRGLPIFFITIVVAIFLVLRHHVHRRKATVALEKTKGKNTMTEKNEEIEMALAEERRAVRELLAGVLAAEGRLDNPFILRAAADELRARADRLYRIKTAGAGIDGTRSADAAEWFRVGGVCETEYRGHPCTILAIDGDVATMRLTYRARTIRLERGHLRPLGTFELVN